MWCNRISERKREIVRKCRRNYGHLTTAPLVLPFRLLDDVKLVVSCLNVRLLISSPTGVWVDFVCGPMIWCRHQVLYWHPTTPPLAEKLRKVHTFPFLKRNHPEPCNLLPFETNSRVVHETKCPFCLLVYYSRFVLYSKLLHEKCIWELNYIKLAHR